LPNHGIRNIIINIIVKAAKESNLPISEKKTESDGISSNQLKLVRPITLSAKEYEPGFNSVNWTPAMLWVYIE